jgi:branched-chain amino acid transport system substrate-binding protein
MRRFLVLAVGFAAALAACGEPGGSGGTGGGAGGGGAPPGDAVRVGVAGPITGEQAKNGQDLVNGTTLAVEEWNARGGVLGRRIEVVSRDDEARAEKAPSVANELIDAKVVGVVGHFNSGSTIPASEAYHKAGVVTITPASTNPFVTDRKYETVFRACGRDDDQGKRAADFIVDVLKAKKVGILDDRTAYGKGLADFVAQFLKGRAEVVVREGFAVEERNFRPYLSKLIDQGVDVWYFGGIYGQAVPLLNQAKQVGLTAPMMSGDGVHGYQEEFIGKLGASAEGVLTTFPPPAAGYDDFLRRFRDRFKADPGPYGVFSYAAAQILLEGVRDAGATDGRKVAAAIRAKPHDTPAGVLEFDAKGDPKAFYTVWIVQGGRYVPHPALRDGGK